MPDVLKVLGARVDALTVAFRVVLAVEFVDRLRSREKILAKHGRVAFEWCRGVPLPLGSVSRWAERAYGELRRGTDGRWLIANRHWRMLINERAAGGGEMRACDRCKGQGRTMRGECEDCEGMGRIEGPGFSVEIVWAAQALADAGLASALATSASVAAALGTVIETRLRRIDLCADVGGWAIDVDNLKPRLAKRPRAIMSEDFEPCGCGKPRGICRCDHVASVYMGSLDRVRPTGLSIGRGGAIMARFYDKRAEMRVRRDEEKREAEEERWREAGWMLVGPDVTRVEFQLRGVVLRELGIRDPDCSVEWDAARAKWVPVVRADGEIVGLVDRLDYVWRTCLDWVRLIEPERTRTGKLKPACRLPLDPRWELLGEVKFASERAPRPIKRVRIRNAASAAQALGVGLSIAARENELPPFSAEQEKRAGWAHLSPIDQIETIRRYVSHVHAVAIEAIVDYLLDRAGGDPAGALEHLAVRSNAKIAYWQGHERGRQREEDDVRTAEAVRLAKLPRVFERTRAVQESFALN